MSDLQGGQRGDRKLRVLLVEDDPMVSSALERALADCGTLVLSVSRLEPALAALNTNPDIVVLDVHLPDGSGLTLAERASGRRPMPLMIAISGRATAAEAFRLHQLGVQGYLPKPLSLADFTATFEAALSRSSDFIPQLVSTVGHEGMREVLDRARKALAEQALARTGGNKTGAARLLGITRQAVQQLISDLGLST